MKCNHVGKFEFECAVSPSRYFPGGEVDRWRLDVSVRCAVCLEPFQFLGLPTGGGDTKPRVTLERDMLVAPIAPMPPAVRDQLMRERVEFEEFSARRKQRGIVF